MSSGARWYPATLLGSLLVALAVIACGLDAHEPQITQVHPATATAGELVLISGRHFDKAAVVWINGQPATRVTWVNERLLTAVVPPDLPTGAYPLEVRSLNGQQDAVSVNVDGRDPAQRHAVAQPGPSASPRPGQPVAAQPTPSPPPSQAATPPSSSAPPAVRTTTPPRQPRPTGPDEQTPVNTAQAQVRINQTFAQVNAPLAELGLPPLPPPVISPTP